MAARSAGTSGSEPGGTRSALATQTVTAAATERAVAEQGMKRVYGSYNNLFVGYLKKVLENHGIRCVLRNEHLAGAAGEVPPIECWPEIWVTDEREWERARRIVNDALGSGRTQETAWRCPACGELLEGQFGLCWKCGESRPLPAD